MSKTGGWLYWTLGALAVLALTTCNSNNNSKTERPVQEWTVQERAAFEKLRQEPKVLDLLFDKNQAVEWNIGVLDDGSKRYGFGEYVCQVLKDMGASHPETRVRIVDVAKVKREQVPPRDASLGTVDCATLQPSILD